MKVLVTGGAGFIGSHLVDALLKAGHQVRIYDNLDPQVHGEGREKPDYLSEGAEFILGDVRDRDKLKKALASIQVVFHQAAAVGVGQSMYEVQRYTEANSLGGAILLDIVVNERNSVEKMLVASSMSIYGEGKYYCSKCGEFYPKLRQEEQLQKKYWEYNCPKCNRLSAPVPTDETKPLFPTSIYAITKRDHEEMFLNIGFSYSIPTVALRYFNVYGPRQALSNPYTGVAAIFSGRILNNNPPTIYEDGNQTRDFVHVKDIVQANLLAMENSNADYKVYNVGTGRALSINEMADILIEKLGKKEILKPQITNNFRKGDIRHCYSDISAIKEDLGYASEICFEDGIVDLTNWVKTQTARDLFDKASQELQDRGLTPGSK